MSSVPEDHDALVDADEQPFLDHLLELRQRILHGLLAVILLFFPVYYFANELYSFVAAPLLASLPGGSQMIATEVASPFLTPFKLSLVAAVSFPASCCYTSAWCSPTSWCFHWCSSSSPA